MRTSESFKDPRMISFDLSTPLTLPTHNGPVLYDPVSCIFHAGASASSGHYTAIARYDNDWFSCNDTHVKGLSAQEAQDIFKRGKLDNADAYVYLFEKRHLGKALMYEESMHRQAQSGLTGLAAGPVKTPGVVERSTLKFTRTAQ